MSATLRFGPYELVHRLGAGGMAETYLGIRRGPGGFEQHVCLKRILPALEADPALITQFLQEAKLAAQLRHANIAQVVDFGEVEGSHYLALELVDGMDLRALQRRLKERGIPFDPSLVVLVGLALSAALELAHDTSRSRPAVIHRDISPSNVLVSRRGEVYLTDFGIARPLGVERRTETGTVRGKVPYMAPEYALDARYDARTNLFGVGVVLYELLAGRRPFDGATELDTLNRIQSGQHPPLASLAHGAPAGLVALVERLIATRPEDRVQSASELTEGLAPFSPPATASRTLGELVRSSGASLSQSLRLGPEPTAEVTAALPLAPAPSYPDVRASAPGEQTRTRDAAQPSHLQRPATEDTSALWASTAPDRISQPGPWASTDPSQVSHHDRPSPYAAIARANAGANAALGSASGSTVPATRPSLPVYPETSTPSERSGAPRWLWVAVAVFGTFAFLAASGGAYLLVRAFFAGPQ